MKKVALFLLAALAASVSNVDAGASSAPDTAPAMVKIPAGEFVMGSSPEEVADIKARFGKRDMYKDYPFDAEAPRRKVFLKAFYIDVHEVTVKEYSEFVHATGHKAPKTWQGGHPDHNLDNHPVTFVTQEDAEAYAKWAGKRLPTAEEWEKAARGAEGRIFPWGDQFDPYKASTAESDLHAIQGALCNLNSAGPVMVAAGDVSPYGVRDMGGNVREWTCSPSQADGRLMMIKGASWVDLSINARAAHMEYIPKSSYAHIVGFRCARDAE